MVKEAISGSLQFQFTVVEEQALRVQGQSPKGQLYFAPVVVFSCFESAKDPVVLQNNNGTGGDGSKDFMPVIGGIKGLQAYNQCGFDVDEDGNTLSIDWGDYSQRRRFIPGLQEQVSKKG